MSTKKEKAKPSRVMSCPVCDCERLIRIGQSQADCFHCGVKAIPIGYWDFVKEV